MTRFVDKNYPKIYKTLSSDSLKYLVNFLKSSIKKNSKSIDSIIKRFLKNKRHYGIFELSSEIVMVLTTNTNSIVKIYIGYPFPIYSEKYQLPLKNRYLLGLQINFYLRGEVLRIRQRLIIKEFFQARYKILKWHTISDINDFQRIADGYFKNNKEVAYIDGYNFIGDSLVGLYFIKKLQTQYRFSKILVLSNAYNHLNYFFDAYPKNKINIRKIIQWTRCLVISDLLDNHLRPTLNLLDVASKKKLFIFLVSRNLIISTDHDTCSIYHFQSPDVLLRNKNIEDYMDECLCPFLKTVRPITKTMYVKRRGARRGVKVLFNPFSSHKLKQMKKILFLKTAAHLIHLNGKVDIYIPKNSKIKSNILWLNSMMKMLDNKKYNFLKKKIYIISDNNLTDLVKKIKRLGIDLALTSDTSMSHLLSLVGLSNITLYNEEFWDKNSPQSLSAESVLGFCRYNLPQYPAVLSKITNFNSFSLAIANGLLSIYKKHKFLKLISQIPEINLFIKKLEQNFKLNLKNGINYRSHKILYREYLELKSICRDSKISWLFEIYDPDQLIVGLNKASLQNNYLIYSSWRNLPLYKFIRNDR